MTDKFCDVHDMAANLSKWKNHLKKEALATSAWVGAMVAPRTGDSYASHCFVPLLRIDDPPEHFRKKDGEKRVTLRDCVVLVDLDQARTYLTGTSFKKITLGGRPFFGVALTTPHPDISKICHGQACGECPQWFTCQGAQALEFGTLHSIEISDYHFKLRAQTSSSKTWIRVGNRISSFGARTRGEPLKVSSPGHSDYVPQFTKEA